MFESLSDRLSQSLRGISGKARLSDENIQDTLREVRMALLEADVALPVVKDFVEAIKQRAIGQMMGEFRSNIVANVRLMRNRTFVRAFFGLPMTSKAGAAIGKMRAASAALMLGQSAAKTPRSPGSVSCRKTTSPSA